MHAGPVAVLTPRRGMRVVSAVLARHLPDFLADLPALTREAVSDDAMAVYLAIRHVAEAHDELGRSDFGTRGTPGAEQAAASPAMDVIDVKELAVMLGVGERQARKLAAGHALGRKTAGGRWLIDGAAAVEFAETRGATA